MVSEFLSLFLVVVFFSFTALAKPGVAFNDVDGLSNFSVKIFGR